MPTSLGLGLTLNWLGLLLEISISELVSFCVAASTSAEGSSTVMSWRTQSSPGHNRTICSGHHGA
jgi:hypothetical protein